MMIEKIKFVSGGELLPLCGGPLSSDSQATFRMGMDGGTDPRSKRVCRLIKTADDRTLLLEVRSYTDSTREPQYVALRESTSEPGVFYERSRYTFGAETPLWSYSSSRHFSTPEEALGSGVAHLKGKAGTVRVTQWGAMGEPGREFLKLDVHTSS